MGTMKKREDRVKFQAAKEIDEEIFRADVDKLKARILERRGFWKKFIPFKITIERR